jgi:hypothetical protein
MQLSELIKQGNYKLFGLPMYITETTKSMLVVNLYDPSSLVLNEELAKDILSDGELTVFVEDGKMGYHPVRKQWLS